jgi:hypothetical protein
MIRMSTSTKNRTSRGGWLVWVALGIALPAVGQEAAPPAQSESLKEGLKIESVEQVPDRQKLSEASQVLARLEGILKDVLKSLEEARSEKDVLKLNCVNEKLTQIKGLLRVVQQSDVSLQEAVAKADQESAQHEYAKIAIAKQRAEQLRADAEQCIGQLAYVDERTVVTVEVPEDLPDVVTNPPTFTPVAVNPPAISPIQ